MPVSHPPIRAHPGNPFRTWSDAARDRQIVIIRCNGCHTSMNFLAEDFALVFGPEQPVHIPPFACSRCGTDDYLDLALRVPSAEDCVTLKVRRPVKPVRRWTWETFNLSGRKD